MRSLLFALLFVPVFFGTLSAQNRSLTPSAEVSILTVGPGDQLFDKFGHTGIRIQDVGMDIVYNYGTYDFNTPNFYTKFARGKLLYKVDLESFSGFLRRYQRQNRQVDEQVLNLTQAQKLAFFNFLQNNVLPENQNYLYDFFYENCATKPRDVLAEVMGSSVSFNEDYVDEPMTFRELIQMNVHPNTWGSLGMDVAIGAVVDRKATPWEHQFLPAYVAKAADAVTLKTTPTQPLVKSKTTLHQSDRGEDTPNFFTSPLMVFGLIGLLILWITYKDYRADTRSRYLDGILFFATGLIGILLCLLWFGTDHSSTVNNYNLLWAFPFSFLFVGAISKSQPKRWLGRYVFFLLLMFVLLTIHWITGVQRFAIGFIPLFIALILRYLYVYSYLKKRE